MPQNIVSIIDVYLYFFHISLNSISIYNDSKGKPFIKCDKNLKKKIEYLTKKRKYNIHLSLADEKDYSVAFVIIQ